MFATINLPAFATEFAGERLTTAGLVPAAAITPRARFADLLELPDTEAASLYAMLDGQDLPSGGNPLPFLPADPLPHGAVSATPDAAISSRAPGPMASVVPAPAAVVAAPDGAPAALQPAAGAQQAAASVSVSAPDTLRPDSRLSRAPELAQPDSALPRVQPDSVMPRAAELIRPDSVLPRAGEPAQRRAADTGSTAVVDAARLRAGPQLPVHGPAPQVAPAPVALDIARRPSAAAASASAAPPAGRLAAAELASRPPREQTVSRVERVRPQVLTKSGEPLPARGQVTETPPAPAGETTRGGSGDTLIARSADGVQPVVATPAQASRPVAAEALLTPQRGAHGIDVPVHDRQWADQVGERVVVMASNRLQNAEIRLTPAELGPVRVQLALDDGAAIVNFTAQHALTREALEQALPRLREMLSENGIALGQASVDGEGVEQGKRDARATDIGETGFAPAREPAHDDTEPAAHRGRRIDGRLDTFA